MPRSDAHDVVAERSPEQLPSSVRYRERVVAVCPDLPDADQRAGYGDAAVHARERARHGAHGCPTDSECRAACTYAWWQNRRRRLAEPFPHSPRLARARQQPAQVGVARRDQPPHVGLHLIGAAGASIRSASQRPTSAGDADRTTSWAPARDLEVFPTDRAARPSGVVEVRRLPPRRRRACRCSRRASGAGVPPLRLCASTRSFTRNTVSTSCASRRSRTNSDLGAEDHLLRTDGCPKTRSEEPMSWLLVLSGRRSSH
jgi:hypothetical protein